MGSELPDINCPIGHKRAISIVSGACVYFFLAGRAFLPHLGIQTDEAIFVAGIYQVQDAYYKVQIFHHLIPLMILSYLGTLKSFTYALLFQMFTPNAASTRMPVLLVGVLSIVLFYRLLARISGRVAAIAGCLLLATDSIFLLTDLFDWGPAAFQHLLLVAGMLLLYRFYESGRLGLLAGGFFLFGLAMWDKALFAWTLSGLAVAAAIVFPRVLWRLLGWRTAAVAGLGFLLGAAPLVMFNIHSKGETFRGNTAWSAEEFTHKLRMAQGTLEGQGLFGYLVRDDNEGAPPRAARTTLARGSERLSHAFGAPRRNLMPAALAGALLLVPLLWRARTRASRTILFAVIVLLVAWPQMAFNRNTGGSVHHVVLLWPFPHLIIAVAFGEAAQKFGRAGKAALALMLALVIPSNLLVTNEYYRMMMRNGGGLPWTDAIYPMADFLKHSYASQILVIDWGMFDSLQLLDRGKLPLRNGGDPLNKPSLDASDRETVRQWLITPGTVFVAHTAPYEFLQGSNQRLEDVARQCGMARESLGVFKDRNGRAIYEVFRYAAN